MIIRKADFSYIRVFFIYPKLKPLLFIELLVN